MDFGATAVIAALAMAAGSVVWSIRQEGRINAHDILFKERDRYDVLRAEESDRRHKENKDSLERIERKMDGYCEYFIKTAGTFIAPR